MQSKIVGLGIACMVFMLSACQSGPEKPEQEQGTTIGQSNDNGIDHDFYKRLEGTIGDLPIVMQLQKAGDQIGGSYSYNNKGQWLELRLLSDSGQAGFIYLSEYDPYADGSTVVTDPYFKLAFKEGRFEGTWTDGKKSLPVQLQEAYPAGSLTFQMLYFEDSLAAFPDKKESPVATISESFPACTDKGGKANWVDRQIEGFLSDGQAPDQADFKGYLQRKRNEYLESYRHDAKDFKSAESYAFLNYVSMQSIEIKFNEKGFLTLQSMNYSYEGGAHGNYGASLYCLDVDNEKTLKISDILKADSSQLLPIMEQRLRKQMKLKPGEPLSTVLFEDRLAYTDNFYFTNTGIGWLYNPYEIASYAQGIVNVFVPYGDLKPYLEPSFIKRMQLSL